MEGALGTKYWVMLDLALDLLVIRDLNALDRSMLVLRLYLLEMGCI